MSQGQKMRAGCKEILSGGSAQRIVQIAVDFDCGLKEDRSELDGTENELRRMRSARVRKSRC